MDAKQIAETILSQLGGQMFIMMTGAKYLSYDKTGALSMKIGRNSGKWTHLTIELTPADDYTMTFRRLRGIDVKAEEVVDGVYFDQLKDIFTSKTGMYTSL